MEVRNLKDNYSSGKRMQKRLSFVAFQVLLQDTIAIC